MKIGDKIICIDAFDSNSLEYGHEYKIVDINNHGNLGLKNESSGSLLAHYYLPHRFKLAPIPPVFKVGQIWRYTTDSSSLFMLIHDNIHGYTLIDLLRGKQHYPWYHDIQRVINPVQNLYEKVADNMAEFIAQ